MSKDLHKSGECILCGAPLEYLNQPVEMECAICHRKYMNNVRCTGGHYVCDECHTLQLTTMPAAKSTCCKRDSYLAVLTAVDFVAENLGLQMEKPKRVICSRSAMNNQCRGSECPFHNPRVLVLCTGNRCRSQMAEAWLHKFAPDWTICSAGIDPASEVHPLAIRVMKEAGIDMTKAYPKSVDLFVCERWDYVITVCGNADKTCPAFAGKVGRRLHIGFDDPDAFTGSEDEILREFRRVRDEIGQSMDAFVKENR